MLAFRAGIVAVVLGALTVGTATTAFAKEHAHAHQGGSFPMTSADFKAKVDARTKKARERMETRASSLDAAAAKELRTQFDAGVAKVNAEVAKATADGTVTADEAKSVRQVAKELRSGHHKHHPKK